MAAVENERGRKRKFSVLVSNLEPGLRVSVISCPA